MKCGRCAGCAEHRLLRYSGRRLCGTCYARWRRLGKPDVLPPARGQAWRRQGGSGAGPPPPKPGNQAIRAKRLAEYRELIAMGVTRQADIAERMGVSREMVRIYKHWNSEEDE